MRIAKSEIMRVGNLAIVYHLTYQNGRYGMIIEVLGDSKRRFSACDVARNLETAEYLLTLFSQNLVFPENAAEIFDDILAEGVL